MRILLFLLLSASAFHVLAVNTPEDPLESVTEEATIRLVQQLASCSEAERALVWSQVAAQNLEQIHHLVEYYFTKPNLWSFLDKNSFANMVLPYSLTACDTHIIEVFRQHEQNVNIAIYDKELHTYVSILFYIIRNPPIHPQFPSFFDALLEAGLNIQPSSKDAPSYIYYALVECIAYPQDANRRHIVRTLLNAGAVLSGVEELENLAERSKQNHDIILKLAEQFNNAPRGIRRRAEKAVEKVHRSQRQLAAHAAAAAAPASAGQREIPRERRQKHYPEARRQEVVHHGFAEQQQKPKQPEQANPPIFTEHAVPATVTVDPLAEARAARADSVQRARERLANEERRASAQRTRNMNAHEEAGARMRTPSGRITPQRTATPYAMRFRIIVPRTTLDTYQSHLGTDSVAFQKLKQTITELSTHNIRNLSGFTNVVGCLVTTLEYRLNREKRAYFELGEDAQGAFVKLVGNPKHLPS